MLAQIKIAARGDAFQFLRAEREFEQNIHAGFGVMREFLRLLPVFLQRRARQADAFVKRDALLDPVFVPGLPAPIGLRSSELRSSAVGSSDRSLLRRHAAGDGFDDFVRLDEKFQFHLLELARAEGEIARRDLVAERLADLRDAERHFLPRGFQHIFELRENRLRGFRAEIGDVVIVSMARRKF